MLNNPTNLNPTDPYRARGKSWGGVKAAKVWYWYIDHGTNQFLVKFCFYEKMTILSRKLRHNAEASLSVFTHEREWADPCFIGLTYMLQQRKQG